jgi:tetratricopeptide (TPR) repeat protein
LEKAIECFETSLRLKRRQYVGGHLSIAETMNLLATAYTSVGKADKAIPLFEETLLIFEKRFGAHMTTANVLDSLGSVYLSEGKLENSHSYLERALALKRLIYGDDDIEVSNTLYFIGKVQSKSGDLNDALNTFKDGKTYLFLSSC